MFVIHGYRIKVGNRVGSSAWRCDACQRIQAFGMHQLFKQKHIYFIPTSKDRLPDILVCGFCQGWRSAPSRTLLPYPAVDPDWTRADGLQKLVDSTNPELGQVVETAGPTRNEVLALFTNAEEISTSRNGPSQGTVLLGALAGVVCSIIAIRLASSSIAFGSRYQESWSKWMVGLGMILGGTAAGYLSYTLVSMKAASKVLRDCISLNGL